MAPMIRPISASNCIARQIGHPPKLAAITEVEIAWQKFWWPQDCFAIILAHNLSRIELGSRQNFLS